MMNRKEMWGPWWSDPDPPEKPMSPEQRKRLADGAYRSSQKAKQQNPAAAAGRDALAGEARAAEPAAAVVGRMVQYAAWPEAQTLHRRRHPGLRIRQTAHTASTAPR